MRVGIDAWGLSGDLLNTGMGRYTADLLLWLPETAPEVQVVAYAGPDEPRPRWLPSPVDWRPVGVKLPAKLTALHSRLFSLPAMLRKSGIDVFHAPAVHWRPLFPPVPLTDCPLVVTLHDLIIFRYYDVQTLPRRQRLFAKWNLRRALQADALITVSENSRNEILCSTPLGVDRLKVVHNAVNFAPNLDAEPLQRLGIRRPYLLYAGSYEPRKNLVGALRAYARLRAEGFVRQLVAIVERQSGHRRAVLDLLANLNLPDGSVQLLHSLRDSDLRSVYTHADAMYFCSFAEGFGFPPLQAAACGVPVAASRLAVLEETLGSCAIYFDPESVTDIATALRRLLSDPELRARLQRVGPVQAARFRPRPWVARHLEIYRELHARQTSPGLSQQQTVWPAVGSG